MLTLRRLLSAGTATAIALLSLGGCDPNAACKESKGCKEDGLCSAAEGSVCIAGSKDDCKESDACKVEGRCDVEKGKCVATSDADCRASENCTKSGACGAYQNQCVDKGMIFEPECTATCKSTRSTAARRCGR